MKIIDRMLFRRAKELEKSDYTFADSKDKKIFDHAVLYMKKGKQRKLFAKTGFTDPFTSAQELECVINYGATVGDDNYYKYSKSEHYNRYVDATIRNQLCKYLEDRAGWEKHCVLIDLDELENYITRERCCLVPPSLDISDFNFTGLTDREIQAVIYYTYGYKDDYVADVLGLSKNTIRTYRRRGLKKMRITNNYQKLLDLSQPIMGN